MAFGVTKCYSLTETTISEFQSAIFTSKACTHSDRVFFISFTAIYFSLYLHLSYSSLSFRYCDDIFCSVIYLPTLCVIMFLMHFNEIKIIIWCLKFDKLQMVNKITSNKRSQTSFWYFRQTYCICPSTCKNESFSLIFILTKV